MADSPQKDIPGTGPAGSAPCLTTIPSPPCLTTIPWEDILFKHVFPNLFVRDLFQLRATCRQLHDCLTQYFSVMTRLDLIYTGPKFKRAEFNLLTERSFMLRDLNLTQAHNWLGNDDLVRIVSGNASLERLDMGGCTFLISEVLETVARCCCELRELRLARCHWVRSEDLVRVAESCPDLEVLDMSGCWEVQDETIISIIKLCPRLRDVNLSEIYSVTDQSIMEMAHHCHHLTTLKLQACWRVTDDSVRLLGEYCKKLGRLHIKDCRSVTEASVARLRVKGVLVDLPRPSYQLGTDYTNWLHNLKLQI